MNRIQFFYDDDLIALQLKINEWLSQNKSITIIATNLSSIGKPSQRAGIVSTEKHVFYIVYSTNDWESLVMEQKTEEAIPEMENLEAKIGLNLTN